MAFGLEILRLTYLTLQMSNSNCHAVAFRVTFSGFPNLLFGISQSQNYIVGSAIRRKQKSPRITSWASKVKNANFTPSLLYLHALPFLRPV